MLSSAWSEMILGRVSLVIARSDSDEAIQVFTKTLDRFAEPVIGPDPLARNDEIEPKIMPS
jgi:hypothetical protein